MYIWEVRAFRWSLATTVSSATLTVQLTASREQRESTNAWVFWPVTLILVSRAHISQGVCRLLRSPAGHFYGVASAQGRRVVRVHERGGARDFLKSSS